MRQEKGPRTWTEFDRFAFDALLVAEHHVHLILGAQVPLAPDSNAAYPVLVIRS